LNWCLTLSRYLLLLFKTTRHWQKRDNLDTLELILKITLSNALGTLAAALSSSWNRAPLLTRLQSRAMTKRERDKASTRHMIDVV